MKFKQISLLTFNQHKKPSLRRDWFCIQPPVSMKKNSIRAVENKFTIMTSYRPVQVLQEHWSFLSLRIIPLVHSPSVSNLASKQTCLTYYLQQNHILGDYWDLIPNWKVGNCTHGTAMPQVAKQTLPLHGTWEKPSRTPSQALRIPRQTQSLSLWLGALPTHLKGFLI